MSKYKEDILYIDYREPDNVQEAVKMYCFDKDVSTRITRMDVGDFYYNKILVERKNCMDFVSSMKDARLINQRNKMIRLAQEGEVHPYIFIEGTYKDAYNQLEKLCFPTFVSKDAWTNSILHTLETGIGVYVSEDNYTEEVAKFTCKLSEYYNQDKPIHDIFVEPEGSSWDVKAYQCFPSIGYNIAKDLANTVKIHELLDMTYEQQIKKLSSVKGVGEKRAKKIVSQLWGKELKDMKGVILSPK